MSAETIDFSKKFEKKNGYPIGSHNEIRDKMKETLNVAQTSILHEPRRREDMSDEKPRNHSDAELLRKDFERLEETTKLKNEHLEKDMNSKIELVETRLESKIDSSMNQVLLAMRDMESRISSNLNSEFRDIRNEIQQVRQVAITDEKVKTIVNDAIKESKILSYNSLTVKLTMFGVAIAAVSAVIAVIALAFQIFS